MLVSSTIIVATNRNIFDTLVSHLRNEFDVTYCGCNYSEIQLKLIDTKADLVISSLDELRENNILESAPSVPNLFVFYREEDYREIVRLTEKGLRYYGYVSKMYNDGEEYIRLVCRDKPYKYKKFREMIRSIVYSEIYDFKGSCGFGKQYLAESVLFVLFSERKKSDSYGRYFPVFSHEVLMYCRKR